MKIKFEWELIYKSEDNITETWRAKTIGGWIVKDFNCIYTDSINSATSVGVGAGGPPAYSTTRRYSSCVAMIFIKDPKHDWVI
jgi:hypothetical protein